jgi:thermostable 8-oxoguanine DNA glycosylase
MQQAIALFGSNYEYLTLPDPSEELPSGIKWGRYDHPLTPAFWATSAWMAGRDFDRGFRLGSTLAEEVCACILGGHGIPAEVGLAAFARVQELLHNSPTETIAEADITRSLSLPLVVNGRLIRYRFVRQRAKYVAAALQGLHESGLNNMSCESSLSDIELRDELQKHPGIGPKTASWIVRNRRESDSVAILDVHVVRACRTMGVFPSAADPARCYHMLETLFLQFCKDIRVRASIMDAVMWGTMRQIRGKLLEILVDSPALAR